MNEIVEHNVEDTSINGKDHIVKRILKYHYSKRKLEEEVILLKKDLAETKKKLAAYERDNKARNRGNYEARKIGKPVPVKPLNKRPMGYKDKTRGPQ